MRNSAVFTGVCPRLAAALAIAAGCAALPMPLAAQNKPPTRVELRLLAFQADPATEQAYVHDPAAPAKTAPVKAALKSYLNHEFTTVDLTGRRLAVTTKPDRDSLTSEAELLGEATLPEGARSVILLFLPAPAGGKARCQILVIDDSKRAFPAGSFRVANLSPHPVRIVLEDKSYNFKSGEVQLIRDPPVRAGNQSGMKAFVYQDNGWQRIGSGIWPRPGNNRVVQILFTNPPLFYTHSGASSQTHQRRMILPPLT